MVISISFEWCRWTPECAALYSRGTTRQLPLDGLRGHLEGHISPSLVHRSVYGCPLADRYADTVPLGSVTYNASADGVFTIIGSSGQTRDICAELDQ
jgi:hypothetical protein